jgi:hypothetical protein
MNIRAGINFSLFNSGILKPKLSIAENTPKTVKKFINKKTNIIAKVEK